MARGMNATPSYFSGFRLAAWVALTVELVAVVVFWIFAPDTLFYNTLSDVLFYELPLLACVVLSFTLWIKGGPGSERRFWGLLGLAMSLILVAEVYWTWYSLAVNPEGPSLAGPVLFVYFAGMLVAGRLLYEITGVGTESALGRMRFVFDALAGATAAYGFVYVLWTLPLFHPTEGGRGAAEAALAALYPVAGVLMLLTSVSIITGWRARSWKRWERLVAASLVVSGVAFVTYPIWLYRDYAGVGPGLTRYVSILGVSLLLLCVAATYRLSDYEGEALGESWPSTWPNQWPGVARAYPVALVVALPVLGFLAFETGRSDHGGPIAASAIVLAVLLAARSVVVAFEQAGNLQKVYTDPATGALNRNWLDTMLRRMLADAAAGGTVMSLVVFDVADEDRFNAVIGHSAGAEVLGRVASVIAEETPPLGEVFSLSEYDFAVMLPGASAPDAAVFARRTWLRLSREATVEGRPLDIAAGVAAFPEHAQDAQGLIVTAETALGMARGADVEPVVVFGDYPDVTDSDAFAAKTRMRALRSTIRALAEAVDARDPHTVEHSANVSELCAAVAQVLDLPEQETQMLSLAALVHDVGKVGVHDEVLLKEGALTADERHEMELHTLLGERILAPTRVDEILPIVRSHHEHWDGSGYPDGLVGDEIPLGARLLALCDAFDAITSGRSYRPARSAEEALDEIHAYAGTHYDPELADAFVRFVRRLDESRATQTIGV